MAEKFHFHLLLHIVFHSPNFNFTSNFSHPSFGCTHLSVKDGGENVGMPTFLGAENCACNFIRLFKNVAECVPKLFKI